MTKSEQLEMAIVRIADLEKENRALRASQDKPIQASGEPVAEVDENDDGLFIAITYGENGSTLKRGDKLYMTTASPISDQVRTLAADLWDDSIRCDFEAFKLRVAAALSTAPTTGSAPTVYLRQSSEFGPWLETGKDDPFAVAFVAASPAASGGKDE